MTTLKISCLYVFSTIVLALFVAIPAQAKTNILFILDGSNSMWGQVEGEAKITSAQKVLGELLKDLPAETQIGLMVYGHREEGSCEDIEVLSGIGQSSTDALISKINALQPKGKTPIAGALQKSLGVLAKYEGDNNNVVLISDGIESCNGDPCVAAKALADAGINARVHVVGFGVSAEEREQLKCIPEMGNGKYFSAANAAELKLAAAEVKEIAVAEATPAPEPVIWFEDNFDGDDLADHWEVINPNPDAFIVEGGKLVVVSAVAANITDEKVENTFRLTKGMPDGDWDAVVKLVPEIQTFQERMSLSYVKDGKNQLTAIMDIAVGLSWETPYTHMHGQKYSKGKVTQFGRMTLQGPQTGHNEATKLAEQLKWFKNNARAIYLKIAKRGRSYVVSSKVEGDATTKDGKKPEWVSVQKLTSLRPPGTNLVLAFPQRAQTNGESIIAVDWVKIVTISNN